MSVTRSEMIINSARTTDITDFSRGKASLCTWEYYIKHGITTYTDYYAGNT